MNTVQSSSNHPVPLATSSTGLRIIILSVIVILLVAAGFGFWIYRSTNTPGESTYLLGEPTFPTSDQLPDGVPDLPVYPGAELKGIVLSNQGLSDEGFFMKWKTQDPVPQVMEWYKQAFLQRQWVFYLMDDDNSPGEQVAKIENEQFKGYVGVEVEQVITGTSEVEIVIDIRHKR